MFVGRTNLSLDDVRMYNRGRLQQYRLHENDCRWARRAALPFAARRRRPCTGPGAAPSFACSGGPGTPADEAGAMPLPGAEGPAPDTTSPPRRHYVNQLVQYATGVEHSTQHLKRHHFRSRFAGQSPWHGWFVEAGQFATDVGNWGRLQAGGAAAALMLTGRATLAQLKGLAALAQAKGAALALALPLPPLAPLLRSAQLHLGGAFAAAAAAGAPGGAAAAAAAASKGTFGGFGAFATSLQLPALLAVPSAAVAAGLRRPLTSGAVAAASAGAGAMALGGAAGTDGGAAAAAGAGRQATLALTTAAGLGAAGAGAGGSHASAAAPGAVSRARETLGRTLAGAAAALQRAAGAPPGAWAARQQQRLSVIAAAEGGAAAQAHASSGSGSFLRGFAWLGGSAARLSGAVAAAARPRNAARGAAAAAGGAAGAAVLGGDGGAAAVEALLAAGGGAAAAAAAPVLSGLRKSGSCGSLLDGRGDASSIHYGGSGGRQTLRLPVPRLSWLRRGSNALVVRGGA
jgi:hypothetical protein